MNFSKIIAISGMSGLYHVVGQLKNGIVVESLATGKRTPAYASHKISALEDISIYTEEGDVPLREVMQSIATKENDGPAIDHKAKPEELKEYFSSILPDYDKDRVYVSDIKKVVRWYNELQATGNLNLEELDEDAQGNDASAENAADEAVNAAPASDVSTDSATEAKAEDAAEDATEDAAKDEAETTPTAADAGSDEAEAKQ